MRHAPKKEWRKRSILSLLKIVKFLLAAEALWAWSIFTPLPLGREFSFGFSSIVFQLSGSDTLWFVRYWAENVVLS